jgi:hypothetical protein
MHTIICSRYLLKDINIHSEFTICIDSIMEEHMYRINISPPQSEDMQVMCTGECHGVTVSCVPAVNDRHHGAI